MVYLLWFFIIFSAFRSFFLLPFWHISGKFNIWDVGNFLIISSTVFYLFRERDLSKFNNIFFWLIFVYFLIIGVQISLTSIIWNQSIIDSFIAIRHQFYYFSFFLFLMTINTPEKIRTFIKFLSFIAFVVSIISIINYFKPGIFYHQWTEGHGIRAGIKRALVPGMYIIAVSFAWYFTQYVLSTKKMQNLISSGFYYFMIIFCQTRVYIAVLSFLSFVFLILGKKIKELVVLIIFIVILLIPFCLCTDQNLLVYNIQTSIEDIVYQKGTWAPRLKQIQVSWELLKKHPWTGAATFLRITKGIPREKIEMIVANTDIGYLAWLKYYGIPGIFWLFLLIIFFYIKNIRLLKILPSEHLDIVYFNLFYFTFVLISFLTLNHFMKPTGIIWICFVLSNSVVLSSSKNDVKV